MPNALEYALDFAAECSIRFNHVNWGGCGVMAALLSDILHSHGASAHIRMVYGYEDQIYDVEELGSDNGWSLDVYEWLVDFHHLIVETTDPITGEAVGIDVNGVFAVGVVDDVDIHENALHDGTLPLEFVREMAFNHPYNWNEVFDRSQIPDMVELAQSFMADEDEQQLAA